jgi:tetratricopeptide (TPR) repeat protein
LAYPSLPNDLQEQVDRVAFVYEPALAAGKKYDEALDAYRDLYELLNREQPSDKRYHKGYPLHNMGYILLRQGKAPEALHYFVLAYIEDLLSETKGEENKADNTAAGRVLHQVYTIKDEFFKSLQNIILSKKESGSIVKDPERILTEFVQIPKPKISDIAFWYSKPPPLKKRFPGMFEKVWEMRVFIGGSYKELLVMSEIKKYVSQKGYEPVVALDFEIPEDLVHHHSLMLLHECKYAIFDLSQEAGQLMEIERVRDYDVKTLAVYQAIGGEPKITEMLKALLNTMSIPIKSYRDSPELGSHIDSFLP